MNRTVLHFLTETDSFSDIHGAALQRWVANVLRFERDPAIVVCPRADLSWGLAHVQSMCLPGLRAYSHLKGRYRLPWAIRRPMLRALLRPALTALGPGSVVWIHNRPDYAAAIAEDVRKRGAKLVLHLHNSLLISMPRCITAAVRADYAVFCSHYLERQARLAFPLMGPTSVIHNGADESRFFPASTEAGSAPRQPPLILFAGRLVPEKGAHVFVEAMWLLRARGVAARGRLVGATGFGSRDTPTAYSHSLRRHAPSNLEFGGYRAADAMADEFRRADIFCSPSIWEEPFGLVNVEAMASALPVVSTCSGGVPEIFAAGGGLLVKSGSAPELAAALELLVRNPDLRQSLGSEGYRSFQRNFTWKTVHRSYREVLSSLERLPGPIPKQEMDEANELQSGKIAEATCPAFP